MDSRARKSCRGLRIATAGDRRYGFASITKRRLEANRLTNADARRLYDLAVTLRLCVRRLSSWQVTILSSSSISITSSRTARLWRFSTASSRLSTTLLVMLKSVTAAGTGPVCGLRSLAARVAQVATPSTSNSVIGSVSSPLAGAGRIAERFRPPSAAFLSRRQVTRQFSE